MGRYINWGDLVGRYSQINKLGGAETVGSNFIDYAEAEVDGRLAPVYSVPFVTDPASAPTLVKDLAIDFALLKATFGKEKSWDRMAKHLEDRIKLILDGKLVIVGLDGAPITQVGGTVWGSNTTYTPIFGMGDEAEFVVDPDRIEAEESARE